MKIITGNSLRRLIVFTIIVSVFLMVTGYIFYLINNKKYSKIMNETEEHFCYQKYKGPVNPVLYINNLKFQDEYIDYYKMVESGLNPVFNFPVKVISPEQPVYPVKYFDPDTILVKIVFIDNSKLKKAYIYGKTLNTLPPKN